MSETTPHQPTLAELYDRFQADRDSVRFADAVSRIYTSGTLERLTVHPSPRIRCAAVFALGFLGDIRANDAIGQAMRDKEKSVRLIAGSACQSVWNRVGVETHQQQLADITRLNTARRHREAQDAATALLEESPGFAEAWYQRGVAWFQLEKYAQAVGDFQRTLELNRYHFVAATALGESYFRLGNSVSAIQALRRALKTHPDLKKVRSRIAELGEDRK